jgi:hypothetical protein
MDVSRMTTAPTRLNVISMSMRWVGKGTTSITTTPTMAVGTPTKVKRLLRNSELSGLSRICSDEALLRGPRVASVLTG